ncbi:MAG: hypothetical protein ACKPJJ_33405 [Planctomycetaceae bacterium]
MFSVSNEGQWFQGISAACWSGEARQQHEVQQQEHQNLVVERGDGSGFHVAP